MRTKPSSAPHAVFGIVAVTGSLALLTGTAIEISADDSATSERAVTEHVTDPGALGVFPCVSAEARADLQQEPPDGEPQCVDDEGNEKPCGPEDYYEMCVQEAAEKLRSCREGAGFWKRVRCRLAFGRAVSSCAAEFLKDTLFPG